MNHTTSKSRFVLALLAIFSLSFYQYASGQSLTRKVENKIADLRKLIDKAEAKGIEATKERMKIRVAEIFLVCADWDEANKAYNEQAFDDVQAINYDVDLTPKQLADLLPDKERKDVMEILDGASTDLNRLIQGKETRKRSVKMAWDRLEIKGDRVVQDGKPVFINDWMFKRDKLGGYDTREFFGGLDGFYFAPNHLVQDSKGKVSLTRGIVNKIKNNLSENFGDPFLGQRGVPDYILEKYPDIVKGKTMHTGFDIDHPQARVMHKDLFRLIVPQLAGKKVSELGYGLTNEPHWNTSGTWSIVDITDYTKRKFSKWLKNRHGNVKTLNERWKSNYPSLDKAAFSFESPVAASVRGTARWYDYMSFNQWRVTEWFSFLDKEIKSHDPKAKTHIKLIPAHWSGNGRSNGLNFESLIELTDVIGNDASTVDNDKWGRRPWMDNYDMEWLGMAMSYDFFRSVNPDGINYNSEGHMVTTGRYTDLFQVQSYVYACHWLATMQGMDINRNWAWTRMEDGGAVTNWTVTGQMGQLPKTLATIHSMIIDLNAHSEEMSRIQEMSMPIRIFYSETSAINKADHMTQIQNLYEPMFFEGHRLGFATENIIKKNQQNWKVLIISNTEYVTESELKALQTYLDRGGVIIKDPQSLVKNEYGDPHQLKLKSGNGKLMTIASSKLGNEALAYIKKQGVLPVVEVSESNSKGGGFKGVVHRSIVAPEGKKVVSLVNLGNENATITLSLKGQGTSLAIKDMIKGQVMKNGFIMKPEDVLLLEVGPSMDDNEGSANACNLKFDAGKVVSYAFEQDKGTSSVTENGNVLTVSRNGWKAIPFNYTITPKTRVEFSFKANIQGGEHAFGFDNDRVLSNTRRFKLYGFQKANDGVVKDYANYNKKDGWKSYSIPVGKHIKGKMNYLFFVMDNDIAADKGDSQFRGFSVYEDENGNGINDECREKDGYQVVNGTYNIQNIANKQNLVSPEWDNYNVLLYRSGPWKDQQWTFEHTGGNKHTVKNVATGRYLEVFNGGCENGSNVNSYTQSDQGHQKWYVQRIKGKYYLSPVHCKSMALDKSYGDGGNAKVWSLNAGNSNQQWRLLPVNTDKSMQREGLANEPIVHVYPNPANDAITLSVEDRENIMGNTKSITLETMEGKVLKSYNTIPKDISLEGIMPGTYLIKVITENGLYYERVNKL